MNIMNLLMKLSLILARTLSFYSIIIWIRIMLTWFVPFSEPGTFSYYIAKIVDPYLNLFRSSKARLGVLDFSPIIAIGLIEVIKAILSFFGIYGTLTLGYILALFIRAFWSYGISLFLILAGIMLLMKTIASFSSSPAFYASSERFSSAVAPITDFVRNTFFPQRKNKPYRIIKESTINLTSLIFVIVMYFVLSYLCNHLAAWALKLPF